MFKTLFVFLFGLMALPAAKAEGRPSVDTLTYYFKNNGQSVGKDSADFSLFIMPLKNGLYPVVELYPNGKTKLIATSNTQSLKLELEGPGVSYYPDGKTSRTANYKDGKLDGEVIDYYANGNKSKVTTYASGSLTGNVEEYYPNGKVYTLKKYDKSGDLNYLECRDSTGIILAENGNGKWLDFDGSFKGYGQWVNVSRNFSGTGKQAIVKNSHIISRWQAVIDTSKYNGYDKTDPAVTAVSIMPAFKYGKANFIAFLKNNLFLPWAVLNAKEPTEITVKCIVEKDGTLTHLTGTSSIANLSEEVLRVVALSSPWIPGTMTDKGPPVRTQMDLLIRFNAGKDIFGLQFVNIFVGNENETPIDQTLPATNAITDDEYNKTGEAILAADADKEPEFAGGQQAFFHFLGNRIKHPAADREKGISGKVIVSFVVEKDGRISNIKALRGPSETLKAEAVRVISLSPQWTPGLKNGAPARVTYTIPINFVLGDQGKRINKNDTTSADGIFVKVDRQPEFPGGLEAFGRFLDHNIKFSNTDKGTSGKVIIKFVVERDGTLSDIHAESGPSESSIKEAIRVMKLSPKWIPGMQNNRPVRVQYTVPINFSLGD